MAQTPVLLQQQSRSGVVFRATEEPSMALMLSTLFWDKKVKIAILTLATFAALC
jgi:hypothetical protein